MTFFGQKWRKMHFFLQIISSLFQKKPIIAAQNSAKIFFFAFFLQIIWSIQKKAVPLHPLSQKAHFLRT